MRDLDYSGREIFSFKCSTFSFGSSTLLLCVSTNDEELSNKPGESSGEREGDEQGETKLESILESDHDRDC